MLTGFCDPSGMTGQIIAVARAEGHRFAKQPRETIQLVAGFGVEGDAHAGAAVQHLSAAKKAPAAPNLRQVHLIHRELFDELAAEGFSVRAGELGENVTTQGIALLDLAEGTRLKLGAEAVIEITGLRNPCRQIDDNVGRGAMAATLETAPDGSLIRKCGVMAVVIEGGEVKANDPIAIVFEPAEKMPLQPV